MRQGDPVFRCKKCMLNYSGDLSISFPVQPLDGVIEYEKPKDPKIKLAKNEIYVYGSNDFGIYPTGWAGDIAKRKFGATGSCKSHGLEGRSYAIYFTGSKREFYSQIKQFLEYAEQHPELMFHVTEIGCEKIGNVEPKKSRVKAIAKRFKKSPKNVNLPALFSVYVK